MNRCSTSRPHRFRAFLLAFAVGGALAATSALAQEADPQRIPPISAKAQLGVLRVTAPPEVLLDKQPARLAPGARIRDRNNLLVVSGALIDQDLVVRYTLDPLGLVHEVWVLTATETAASANPPPAIQPY